MISLSKGGAYLINGTEVVEVTEGNEAALKSKLGDKYLEKDEALKNTIAYNILEKHNTSGNMDKLLPSYGVALFQQGARTVRILI